MLTIKKAAAYWGIPVFGSDVTFVGVKVAVVDAVVVGVNVIVIVVVGVNVVVCADTDRATGEKIVRKIMKTPTIIFLI